MAYPGIVLKMACFQSQSHWLMNCLNPIDIDRHRQAHRGISLFLPVVWLLNRQQRLSLHFYSVFRIYAARGLLHITCSNAARLDPMKRCDTNKL